MAGSLRTVAEVCELARVNLAAAVGVVLSEHLPRVVHHLNSNPSVRYSDAT